MYSPLVIRRAPPLPNSTPELDTAVASTFSDHCRLAPDGRSPRAHRTAARDDIPFVSTAAAHRSADLSNLVAARHGAKSIDEVVTWAISGCELLELVSPSGSKLVSPSNSKGRSPLTPSGSLARSPLTPRTNLSDESPSPCLSHRPSPKISGLSIHRCEKRGRGTLGSPFVDASSPFGGLRAHGDSRNGGSPWCVRSSRRLAIASSSSLGDSPSPNFSRRTGSEAVRAVWQIAAQKDTHKVGPGAASS